MRCGGNAMRFKRTLQINQEKWNNKHAEKVEEGEQKERSE
jgi:hypothetical protein